MGGFFLLFDVSCMDISHDKFILGNSLVTRTAGTFHGKRVISHGKSVPFNRTYYMAESVFALRLIFCSAHNLLYKPKFQKQMLMHFVALHFYTSKNGLN